MVSYLVSNMCNTYEYFWIHEFLSIKTNYHGDRDASISQKHILFSTFDKILWQTKMETCSKLEWMLDLTDESKPQISIEICWILLSNKAKLSPVTMKKQHILHTIQLLEKNLVSLCGQKFDHQTYIYHENKKPLLDCFYSDQQK